MQLVADDERGVVAVQRRWVRRHAQDLPAAVLAADLPLVRAEVDVLLELGVLVDERADRVEQAAGLLVGCRCEQDLGLPRVGQQAE
jgi:hypothetical protein